MNDATKFRIRRELAERMSYLVLPTASDLFTLCFPSGEPVGGASWPDPADVWSEPPDPFTDHADCAALVEWLAGQGDIPWGDFITEILFNTDQDDKYSSRQLLTSPLETRVLAACAALGISTGDE